VSALSFETILDTDAEKAIELETVLEADVERATDAATPTLED
jgi:hypothetical protein